MDEARGDVIPRGKAPEPQGGRSRPGVVRVLVSWVVGFLLLALLASLLWFALLPWPISLRFGDPGETSFMAFRREEARRAGEVLTIQRSSVPLGEISPLLQRAVLVAEDDRFYQHHGIDWRALGEEVKWQGDTLFSWFSGRDRQALREAVRYYRSHRDQIKGRSTITQQLAKNLYFTPNRSLLRKLNEAVVAKRLEWFLQKERILELYLNVVELGPGIFGVEAAAQAYFGHSARSLSREEAAALAATLPHPLSSNPGYRPAQMRWRKEIILQRLGSGLPLGPPPVEVPILPVDSAGGDSVPGRGEG